MSDWIKSVLTIFCAIALFFIAASSNIAAQKQDVSVEPNPMIHVQCASNETDVPILAAPASPKVIANAGCGEELTVLYAEIGYYKVETNHGEKGYIARLFAGDLEVATSTAEKPYIVGRNGVSSPKCIHCPDAKYTQLAREAKYQGTIILQVVVSADGRPSNVQAVGIATLDHRRIGLPELDAAWVSLEEVSIDAVKRWRFQPAVDAGNQPVQAIVPIEETFRLL